MYAKFTSEVLFWVQSVEEENNDSDDNENQRKKQGDKKRKELKLYFIMMSIQCLSYAFGPAWFSVVHMMTMIILHKYIPMISGMPPKHPCGAHNSLTTAFTGAAQAIAKAFTPSSRLLQSSQYSSGSVGISPGKRTETSAATQGTPVVV